MLLRTQPWLSVLFLGLLCLFGAKPSHAFGDVFSVKNVTVDVSGDTAAAAQEQALVEGQRLALEKLLDRLVLVTARASVPEVPAPLLSEMVQDFGVANERRSAVRYIADFSVTFRPEPVRRFLRDNAVPFAEMRSRRVLVLPVYEEGEEAYLWQDPNPWRAAWAQARPDETLVPFQQPLGDLADIASVDAAGALRGDLAALSSLSQRYGGSEVMVSSARIEGDPEAGTARVLLSSSIYRNRAEPSLLIDSQSQLPQESLEDLLQRAIAAHQAVIAEEWKEANVLRYDSGGQIFVSAPLTSLRDLIELRRRIDGVAGISAFKVERLSRQEAKVQLAFLGTQETLRQQLNQVDLLLEVVPPRPGQVQSYRLMTVSAAAAAAAEAGQTLPENSPAAPPTAETVIIE